MSMYFKRFILLFATIALLASTSGCSVSEKTCLQNDWQTLGYKHGEDGKSADALNRYIKDCAEHGVTPDASAYSAGYEVGIELYCTAENGVKEGSEVNEYSGACPAELEKPFLENYLEGLRLAMDELKIEYDQDTIELDELRANRDRLADAGESFVKDDDRIKTVTSRISTNTSKRSSINGYVGKDIVVGKDIAVGRVCCRETSHHKSGRFYEYVFQAFYFTNGSNSIACYNNWLLH